MGRTSKRLCGKNGGNGADKKGIVYKAGIYARLSSHQGGDKTTSIETQVEIAKKFVEEWNEHCPDKIGIVEQFIDLGKTGTNFSRDAFGRLMQSVRLGDINCVIVKDLSRFGRNYLEAGNYIEKIFPFLGVRFVAVSDGLDTASEENGSRRIATEIRNLIHDMYARDSSKKAKIHLKQRREEGSYVGGPPPYGYQVQWDGRLRKLVPDENTAEIVRCMFCRFVKEQSYQAVVNDLNQKRINPPSVYRETKSVCCPQGTEYKGWERGSVEQILKNENYTGRLVQGKTSIRARNEANRVANPPSSWVVTEQAHMPLIEASQFEQAADIRNHLGRNAKSQNRFPKEMTPEENIFDRVLYCGVCGHKMTRTSYSHQRADGTRTRKIRFICPDSGSGKTEKCPVRNCISGKELGDMMSVLLEKELSLLIGRQKNYVEMARELIHQAETGRDRERKRTECTMEGLMDQERERYMAYRSGVISQRQYEAFRMENQQIKELARQANLTEESQGELRRRGERYLKAVRSLIRWRGDGNLTGELVETLMDRIDVYPGKCLEVTFSYMDPFAKEVVSR